MSEQKTHAEIIADMRYKAGVICPWQVNGGTCELCPLGHSPHGKDLWKYCSFHKLAHELEAAHKREIDEIKKQVADLQQQLPKPDPNWRDICARCFENGATEPPDCKYYSEDGCMSPIPDQHPLIQVVNMAKLREALLCIGHIAEYLEAGTVKDLNHAYRNIQDRVEIALAAPARNCDVGTLDEQRARLKAFCDSHGHGFDGQKNYSCENCPFIDDKECELAWANQPISKEGGAK